MPSCRNNNSKEKRRPLTINNRKSKKKRNENKYSKTLTKIIADRSRAMANGNNAPMAIENASVSAQFNTKRLDSILIASFVDGCDVECVLDCVANDGVGPKVLGPVCSIESPSNKMFGIETTISFQKKRQRWNRHNEIKEMDREIEHFRTRFAKKKKTKYLYWNQKKQKKTKENKRRTDRGPGRGTHAKSRPKERTWWMKGRGGTGFDFVFFFPPRFFFRVFPFPLVGVACLT